MKFPRAGLHIKRATGICVGESRVLVAVSAAALRGPKAITAFEVPVGPGGPLEALRDLANDPRVSGTVALGFDPRREFSATLRLKPEEQKLSVADLLTARIGRVDGGLVGAMLPLKLPGGHCAVVTALPRKSASTALEAFAKWNADRLLLLPVAHQLHRLAAEGTRGPRRWRTKIRVIPGNKRGLAILSTGRHPLAWRLFPWSEADPVGSIEAAVLMLVSHAREELGLEAIDGVLLHCTPEHAEIVASSAEVLGVPVKTASPMFIDESTIATALASGALAHQPGDLNLFEELLPQPGLRANFPIASVALLTVVMLSAGGMLYAEASRSSESASRLEKRVWCDSNGKSLNAKELEGARTQLASEVERAHNFIVDRVLWAPLLKELPDLLPENMTLTEFDGRGTLKGFGEGGQATGGKRAIIQGEVPFEGDTTSPPEVGILTSRVVASSAFKKSFPDVTGAKVRLKPGVGQGLAKLMVICMPKGG